MAGGSSAMEAYDVSWDRPHRADGNERWQESDCYWFYDATAGVGGFHRIGQQPNRMKGQVSLFVFALDGDRYVSNSELDYEPGERWAVGQRVGSHTAVSLKDKEMRFTWDEPESSADLHWCESFYEPRNWPLHARFFMSHVNSDGHLECGGRLRGMVRIGARTYQIDALAHRDRSWGYRGNETSNHRYRMFSGTVGPEFSVASYSLDLVDGGRSCAGHVIRNGVENDVVDLRCLTTFDADGFSPLGATAILTLDTGEAVRVACRGIQGRGGMFSDTICEITVDGKTGFVDLELANNPGRGTHMPRPDELTLLASPGLSKCVDYSY
jgi:hypothetical protein